MSTEDNAPTPDQFAGQPDAWQRLWTPHRMVYIGGENKPRDTTTQQCPFCRIPSGQDEDGLVVYRGAHVYAVLNLYPYNAGHLMVVPYQHVSLYSDISPEVVTDMGIVTQQAMTALARTMNPAGFNIGMNQGEAGGAGIAAHLHQHIVPRWVGDANFFPIIGQTKAIPSLLADTRHQLATAWPTP
ncbi:HIT family protein [Jonesia denitrificans]|uniref:Histidine triad (HIT) protein n=1 Tax=Jonesia denitrificans (strain ATCC 14870 / DSM 20603 / BCRC 15368 / CIP 55.134 / JCM 11481 / NBRC 15587 / NCTC 10816 / Prevot 55134) TaxID=471856 RepID=C7R4H6_JONDD|nr:HIT domain-containing protein [Jonesia denitrificans]ACV09033.1 histidine triad (HIT) protein [Jonesia denitrificans DSM 20603]ASE09674.1 HIT domain-containing protein [Jonesia denitrificans]QXB44213.1 HIT domain-containing protein [Jonesia denitrificans]SQH21162.1 AP-4-A phosphorylase [Jonesia denitrificans]